jgi:hypothetical protein
VFGPVEVDRIEWRAPEECPDDAAVEARIAAMLGATHTVAQRAVADVDGELGGYTVELATWIDGASQARTLQAEECAVLAEAVAVVVAVALDPVAVVQTDDNASRLAETTETAAPSQDLTLTGDTTPSVHRNATPPPRRRWSFGSRVAGGYGLGTAPGGTGLVGLALYAETGRARLEIEGRYWAPRRIREGDAGARVQLGTVGVAGCLQLSRPPDQGEPIVTAPVCAGLEAGALRAAGFQLPDPRVVNLPWLAPLARAALQVRVHARVRLWLALEGAVLALRPKLQQGFAEPRPLWEAPPVSARVMLGVDARWTR